MREYLYRIYNANAKKWLKPTWGGEITVGDNVVIFRDFKPNGNDKYVFDKYRFFEIDEKIAAMQYTGVKDKNSTKIFEMDIVRAKDYGRYFNLKVEYLNVGYMPFIWMDEKIAIGDIDFKECEVIGNIYDNPELSWK